MISALIVDSDREAMNLLDNLLAENCPNIQVSDKTLTYNKAFEKIETINPDLVFLETDMLQCDGLEIFNRYFPSNFEVIATSTTDKHAIQAFNCCASGYLVKPICKEELINSVYNVSQRIIAKKLGVRNLTYQNLPGQSNLFEEIIGVPTIDGYEFIAIKDIIRCEGMQKCTRIVTKDRTDIISSYNLGEFRKSLEQFGFFSPHKSHLINLNLVRKYHKEGNILMLNGSWVPVSARRKKEFINKIRHI
jgi:two-component system LytT family response regulator